MNLNVNGRYYIVAFYTTWFLNRYKEGYVDVRNLFFEKLVSKIYFSDVDLILFCTKNPLPIIPFLNIINHPILFHVTITPYNREIEFNVISKTKIIECVKELSKMLESKNVFCKI